MREKNFKIGDRVKAFGLLGRIITKHFNFAEWYGIEFDEPHHTYHSCGGSGKPGHCYWVNEANITLIERKPVKLYNGKFVVIGEAEDLHYTVGKIYEVKNGRWVCDNGAIIPVCEDSAMRTFEDVKDLCLAKIIEVVE